MQQSKKNMKVFLLFGVTVFYIIICSCSSGKKFVVDSSESRKNVKVEYVTYKSEGLNVKGVYVEPRNIAPGEHPAVIFNHGGVSGVSKGTVKRCSDLAKEGYIVFAPSYRGEDGGEGEIEIAAGEVDDVLNAFYILRKNKKVNPEKIAMLGTSHGALISILAAVREPDIAAVIEAYGVMDIVNWYYYLVEAGFDVSDPISVKTYGKGPKDKPEAFKKRSAVDRAHLIKQPVLITQGELDKVVPKSQALALKKAFDKAGKKNYILNIYPYGKHGFVFWDQPELHTPEEMKSADSAWQDIIDFLRKNLK